MSIRTIILGIFFFSSNMYAQTCCSGGVPVSNNIGMNILQKGTFQIGLSYDYNNLSTLKDGELTIDEANRRRITNSILLNLGYNITEDWIIEALLTWVNQSREVFSVNGSSLSETKGIGDWVLLTRYRLLKKEGFELSTGFGLKLPTGKFDLKDSRGITLNADIQPGSNALDYIFIASLLKKFNFRETFSLFGRVVYRVTGENDEYQKVNRYSFGNDIQAYFGVIDEFFLFNQIFYVNINFKYRIAKNDLLNNNSIPNTGGEWFFLMPQIGYKATSNLIFSIESEFPLYSKVTGIQLSPSYRLNFGIRYSFSKKSNTLNY